MEMSDILKLHNDGTVEELATFSLSGRVALDAYLHYKNKKSISDTEIKRNGCVIQSKNNPRVFNLFYEDGSILSAIERVTRDV